MKFPLTLLVVGWLVLSLIVGAVISVQSRTDQQRELIRLGCWLADPLGEYQCSPDEVTLPDKLAPMENLDLHNAGLTSLPPEIRQLTSLRELQALNNHITALPPGIGQLSALEVLLLAYNQLTALPPEIGQLASLEVLYLTGNQLTALPPEIGRLNSLKTLWVGDNPITFPPPEIVAQGTPVILAYLRESAAAQNTP